MNINDIYDKSGIDGSDNEKAFKKLPVCMRYFIDSQQKLLTSKVVNNVRSKYGENGLKDLVKTSGFRAISTNNRNGGVIDSLHLFGLACDFAKVGIFKDIPIPVCCNLQCIDSGKCWHIQFKRGV